MNKFTDIFANFIEGFSFRQGSQDVKQVKKGAFLKAFTITLIIGLIGEYAFLIPLNLRSPQFIIYFCILLLIFNGLYFMLSQRFSKITKYSLIVIGILIAYVAIGTFVSSPIFNAGSYQKQLKLATDSPASGA